MIGPQVNERACDTWKNCMNMQAYLYQKLSANRNSFKTHTNESSGIKMYPGELLQIRCGSWMQWSSRFLLPTESLLLLHAVSRVGHTWCNFDRVPDVQQNRGNGMVFW